jgi:sigma-B regulation protein RsbU (phosphoserine phosphatase)
VNAGHNPPVLIHDGKAAFPEMEADLILGLMDDEEYHTQTLHMKKGDILFLYTDGVTEAVDTDRKLYGEERLIGTLNETAPESGDICGSVCRAVTDSVKGFAGGAPQADDMTMLCLYYNGGE